MSAPEAETRPPLRRPFWLLATMTGSAALGLHVFIPALPLIAEEFRVDPARTQLTISLYMFVIALGQLFYGPLSDWLGRRPVLVGALGLFVVAGLACAVAPTFESLLAARLVQAAGGCAGLVLGRAIIQDTTEGIDAAATVAMVNSVLLISPTLSPLVGTWIVETWDWRLIPVMLSLIGSIVILGVLFRLSETNTSDGRSFGDVLSRYRRLLRNGGFLMQVAGGSLTTTTMFILLSASPFIVLEELGMTLRDGAWFYTVFVVGLLLGNTGSSWFVRRLGFAWTLLLASLTGVVGSLLLVVTIMAGTSTVVSFLTGGVLYTLMAGALAPLTLTRAIGYAPDLRGSAAGLFGASQFATAAICVTLSGLSRDVPAAAAGLMLLCAVLGTLIHATLLLQRK